MRLIPEWRKAWRMFSVQVAAVIVAWSVLPADQQRSILELLHLTPDQVTAVLGMLVWAGRLIDQPRVRRQ